MAYIRRVFNSTPPDLARRYFAEDAGDVKARWMLINRAEQTFNAKQRRASAILIHAERYLDDRDEYARNPWPKDMILPYVDLRSEPDEGSGTNG